VRSGEWAINGVIIGKNNNRGHNAPNVYLLLYPTPQFAALIKEQPEALEYAFTALRSAISIYFDEQSEAGFTRTGKDVVAALRRKRVLQTTSSLVPGGRVYGGGLNKIEPRELQLIEFPMSLGELRKSLTRNPSAVSLQSACDNSKRDRQRVRAWNRPECQKCAWRVVLSRNAILVISRENCEKPRESPVNRKPPRFATENQLPGSDPNPEQRS
jgi:hypothetical protein